MSKRNINWADWTFALVGTALAPLGFILLFADAWFAFAALVLGFFGLRAAVLHWLRARNSRRREEESRSGESPTLPGSGP